MTGCLRLFDTSLRCANTCNNVYCIYKTEWILEGSSNWCLNFALHYNSKYWIVPTVFWSTYPWYIKPMEFWPPYPWYIEPHTHGILNPYPWYCDLSMVFWPPTHSILNPLPMVFWTPYPWYMKPPTHGILTPYPWYIEPFIHDVQIFEFYIDRNSGSIFITY